MLCDPLNLIGAANILAMPTSPPPFARARGIAHTEMYIRMARETTQVSTIYLSEEEIARYN